MTALFTLDLLSRPDLAQDMLNVVQLSEIHGIPSGAERLCPVFGAWASQVQIPRRSTVDFFFRSRSFRVDAGRAGRRFFFLYYF